METIVKSEKIATHRLQIMIHQIIYGFLSTEIGRYDEKLSDALKQLGEFLETDRSYLFEYDFSSQTCSNTHEWCRDDIEPVIESLQNVPFQGMQDWVDTHTNGNDIYIDDVSALSSDDTVRMILEPQGVQSLLSVPLFDQGTCIGFLGLDSVREKRKYTSSERDILHDFGKILMFLVQKKNTEKALTKAKNDLQEVLDWQKDFVIRILADGTVLFVNQALKKFMIEQKISIDENIYVNTMSMYSQLLRTFRDHFDVSNEDIFKEWSVITPSGSIKWIRWDVQVIGEERGQKVYQATGVDITELKKTQIALELEKNKLDYTIEASDLGVWEWDKKSGKLYYNAIYHEMLGYEKSEFMVESVSQWEALIHEDDLPKVRFALMEALNGNKPSFQSEYRMRHKDGSYIWIHDTGKIMKRNARGEPLMMYGTHYDVTLAKEEEMQRQAILQAVEASPVVVIITDKEGNIVYANRQMEVVTGYQKKEVYRKNPRLFQSGYHNKAFFEKMWQEITENGIWNGSFRNRKKNGEFYWEEAIIKKLLDANGELIGYVGIKEDITKRLELEKIKEDFGNQLEKLANQVPGAMYQYLLKRDGSSFFPITSKGVEDIYELSQEMMRDNADEVFKRIHPEDRMDVMDSIHQSAASLETWNKRYRVILPKRGIRWILGTANPEKLSDDSVLWHGYLVDVTSDKDLEEKLKKSEEQLRLSIEGAEIGFWDWNLETEETTFSENWKSMLGYEPDEIEDTYASWEKLWHPEDVDAIRKALNDYLNGERDRYEIIHRLKHKTGEYRWILARGNFIPGGSKVQGRFVGIHMDITERKKTEEKLVEINLKLDDAMKEAQSANALKTAFLANISHEIRTPINAVLGFSYLLKKEEDLSETAVESINHIIKGGEHLLSLISDVLDLSKIEAGSIEMNKDTFRLNTLLDDLGILLGQEANKKGLLLNIEQCSNEYELRGDLLKIRQILINLVVNAIKYTETGSVDVYTEVQDIGNGRLKVSFLVKDSGIGIPEKDLPNIFEMFYRSKHGQRVSGSGLGLQICKKYAEVMRGDITVLSKESEGSEFAFHVPLEGSKIITDIVVPFVENTLEITVESVNQNEPHKNKIHESDEKVVKVKNLEVLRVILNNIHDSVVDGDIARAERLVLDLYQWQPELSKKLHEMLEQFDYGNILSYIRESREKE